MRAYAQPPKRTYHKGSSLNQKLSRQLQRVEHQLGLVERILHPGGTDVGRTVVQHAVGLPCLEMAADGGAALFRRDVALEGDDLGDGLDGREVDTDDQAVGRHGLGGDLAPRLHTHTVRPQPQETGRRTTTYTGRGAQIEHDLALLEEAIFLVELDQLEGGSGTIPLFLGELVPLVETALAVLLLDRHGSSRGVFGVSNRGDGGAKRQKREAVVACPPIFLGLRPGDKR